MRNRFEKFGKNNILLSVVMVLLGLLLIIWPGKTMELAARIVGVGLLVGAVISGLSWYKGQKDGSSDFSSLAVAILLAILGLVVLIAPKGIISLIPKIIGVAVLLNGVFNLAQALELKRMGGDKWISSLVMSCLTIVLGLFLVVFAFSVVKAAIMVIGAVILYNGASNLWIEFMYRKSSN